MNTTPQNQSAFPLSWPQGWPRSKFHSSHPFKIVSMEKASWHVLHELGLLGGQRVVISTNIVLRMDGLPRSNRVRPNDPGAAVYFWLNQKPCVLAADKWKTPEANLWAIAKHIDAMRGQRRWGVGSIDQQFAGYKALPPPGSSAGASWWDVLQVPHDCTYEAALTRYRAWANEIHPDRAGGSHNAMSLLNAAWDQARAHFGK